MHLVLHCKRLGNLALRAREDFAVGGVAFYDGLFGVSGAQGQDMGGNIEVSPPIRQPSNSMPAGAAGPAVPAQPPAPFGKIVFGSPDQAHRETRAFLLAQRVQPVLPIDTSWLRVGHVDEIMTTVPDGRGGFKLLVASAHAMTNLLERAAQVSRPYASNLHVGKYEPFVGAPTTPVAFLYAELEIEDLLRTPIANLPEPRLVREGDASAPAPTISVRDYNDRLQVAKLDPIVARLRSGLGLNELDDHHVLPIPMYFRVPDGYEIDDIGGVVPQRKTRALTMGCVNLQIVGTHLLVPRPVGPRLPPSEARQVLGDVLRALDLGHLAVRLGSESVRHWSPPRERNGRIHHYYARLSPADRRLLIDALQRDRASVTLSEPGQAAVAAVAQRVAAPFRPISGSEPRWRSIVIDGCGVDLVESFLLTILAPLGLTVHFIEAWNYHLMQGSVHCATNVRRTPPSEHWWEHGYDPVGPRWRYSPGRTSPR